MTRQRQLKIKRDTKPRVLRQDAATLSDGARRSRGQRRPDRVTTWDNAWRQCLSEHGGAGVQCGGVPRNYSLFFIKFVECAQKWWVNESLTIRYTRGRERKEAESRGSAGKCVWNDECVVLSVLELECNYYLLVSVCLSSKKPHLLSHRRGPFHPPLRPGEDLFSLPGEGFIQKRCWMQADFSFTFPWPEAKGANEGRIFHFSLLFSILLALRLAFFFLFPFICLFGVPFLMFIVEVVLWENVTLFRKFCFLFCVLGWHLSYSFRK